MYKLLLNYKWGACWEWWLNIKRELILFGPRRTLLYQQLMLALCRQGYFREWSICAHLKNNLVWSAVSVLITSLSSAVLWFPFVWIKRKRQSHNLRLWVDEMHSETDTVRESEETQRMVRNREGPCHGNPTQEMPPSWRNNGLIYKYTVKIKTLHGRGNK